MGKGEFVVFTAQQLAWTICRTMTHSGQAAKDALVCIGQDVHERPPLKKIAAELADQSHSPVKFQSWVPWLCESNSG